MKKTLLSVTLLLALAALISGCAGGLTNSSNARTKTMDVTGVGKVKIEPDIARVNIGVRTQSPEISGAFEENTEIAQNIIQKLMDMGVEQKDIQTRNFNIYQQQEPRPMEEDEEGPGTRFIVENTVAVVVRDLDSLGEILSTIVSEGANTIHGITFDIEDRQAAEEEARQRAIEDAKSQAEAIAKAAGIKLGDIRSISINQNGWITPRAAYDMAEEAAMAAGEVPVSSGTLTIEMTANFTFDIN